MRTGIVCCWSIDQAWQQNEYGQNFEQNKTLSRKNGKCNNTQNRACMFYPLKKLDTEASGLFWARTTLKWVGYTNACFSERQLELMITGVMIKKMPGRESKIKVNQIE